MILLSPCIILIGRPNEVYAEAVKGGQISWMDGTEVTWRVEQTFPLSSKRTSPQGILPEASSRTFSRSPGFTRTGST